MAATHEPSSYFAMPGAFHSEGVHPGLIRPPASPAATPNSTVFSSGVLPPGSPSTPSALPRPTYKRRRPANGSATKNTSSPSTQARGSTGSAAAGSAGSEAHHFPSGQRPLTTGRSYVLAGNLDTPGAVCGAGGPTEPEAPGDTCSLGESMFSDSDYRTVLGSKRRRDEIESDHTTPPTLYTLPSEPSQKAPGWGSFAFSTLGGVVGKVWDFCWGSTFRGFHAGAGRGYDAPSVIAHEETDSALRDVPGAWNHDDEGSDIEDTHVSAHYTTHRYSPERGGGYDPATSFSRASTPTRQPAKRRQMDKTDDLGRNWVVINQHDTSWTGDSAPRPSLSSTTSSSRQRKAHVTPSKGRRVLSTAESRTSGQAGRQTPRSSMGVRRSSSRASGHFSSSRTGAWEKPPVASTASYASPRSSPVEAPRDFSSRDDHGPYSPSRRRSVAALKGLNAGESKSRSSHHTPARPSHRRTHSNASAASARSPHAAEDATIHRRQSSLQEASNAGKGSEADVKKQSPRLTEEARRLAAKRKMEERDADVRIAAFNRRLQDMIRQGKEALGTTVDVDMEGPGDGAWEDDE